MMGGLRDQLLRSGLVTEKQVKKAQQEKRKEARQPQGNSGATFADAEKRRLAQAEKAERDRQLNRARKQDAENKAMAGQIRQLIETHRQSKGEGDIPFHFVDGGKVKRMYVSDGVRGQIVRGQLAIVTLDRQYELVPAAVADKIRQRNSGAVVFQHDPQSRAAPDAGDDPYAAHQVPDDLMW